MQFVLALFQNGLWKLLLSLHELLELALEIVFALLGLSLILFLQGLQVFLHGLILGHACEYIGCPHLSEDERTWSLAWLGRCLSGVDRIYLYRVPDLCMKCHAACHE